MAVRYKITFSSNNIYFITFTICDWQKVFVNDEYCNLVYKWFDYSKEKYNNKIHAYVIMPNHIHVLTYISSQSPNISKLIQNAKRFLAYGIVDLLKKDNKNDLLEIFEQKANYKKGSKHKVFEARYDSKIIESENIFIEKLNYIHRNPCTEKWQLADLPERYPHSSADNYASGKGVCEIDFL